MEATSDILAQYQHLELSGNLDLLADLRRENRELEKIITDAALLVSYTDLSTMLDYVIAKILDHFVPQFLAFLVHPPRGDKIREYCYRNLKETDEQIAPMYYELFRRRFERNPVSATFAELSEELGPDLFDQNFLKIMPELVFPMFGIGGLYGIVILGSKIVGSSYTELEQKYVDRIIRFLSVAMQNGLHYESSITDPKTGLFTHDFFMRRLEEAVSSVKRKRQEAGILMFDVDHFKRFNDTWGHITGDAVLIALAETLKRESRGEDCVARFGGEEFSVLVLDCNGEGLMIAAERIRRAVEDMVLVAGEDRLSVTVSIGARIIDPELSMNATKLIEDADKALYRSKMNGRNRSTLFVKGLLDRAKSLQQ